MSRSNPHEGVQNPATRYFKWNGENGIIQYYDRDAKENVDVGSDFKFLLLDQLGTVRGWHDASQSGIWSNEVKDTRADVMIVKAFKGGELASGLYKDIKDRVNAQGGRFNASCYIAYKGDSGLSIGCLLLKGAALSAWMEFTKANRTDLLKKAVRIHGSTEGKKGRITFHAPVFKVVDTSEETNAAATALDIELQAFLSAYFKKNKKEQVAAPPAHVRDEDVMDDEDTITPRTAPTDYIAEAIDDSDIPF